MAYEQRPGSGTLFQNDQQGNDRAPTHRGELCLMDGTVIKIAGWRKEGRKGPFLSLSIDKPKEDDTFRQTGGGGGAPVAGRGGGRPSDAFDDPDMIPFVTPGDF